MSEMPHWLNILMCEIRFPKFFTFQPSAKNNFGKNLKFHDFSMTQTIFSNFHNVSSPGMQISNFMTFHDLSITE